MHTCVNSGAVGVTKKACDVMSWLLVLLAWEMTCGFHVLYCGLWEGTLKPVLLDFLCHAHREGLSVVLSLAG